MFSTVVKCFIGLLFLIGVGVGFAKETQVTITVPADQKYHLAFDVKESICIKNVEKLHRTFNQHSKALAGKQAFAVVREMEDEDNACHERPAVLYFFVNTPKKHYSCLLSYEFGGMKVTGFLCREGKGKQVSSKCISAKLLGDHAAEVQVTC